VGPLASVTEMKPEKIDDKSGHPSERSVIVFISETQSITWVRLPAATK
jgi:hypothetical protein